MESLAPPSLRQKRPLCSGRFFSCGDPLTAQLVDGPANETLVLNPDGSFTYIPDVGFSGTDSFTCQASG